MDNIFTAANSTTTVVIGHFTAGAADLGSFNYLCPTPGHRAFRRAVRWSQKLQYIAHFTAPLQGAFDQAAHRAACSMVGIIPKKPDGTPIKGNKFTMLWEGMK